MFSTFMPPEATKIASEVDDLYKFVLIVSAVACSLCVGGMIYFVVRYRRRSSNDKTAYITHNNLLEFVWSFIPFMIFVILFAWGWNIFHKMRNVPEDAMEIHVTGKQWLWEFQYKNGRATTNDMYVPINAPIRLIMTSPDVLHSFYVPSFRIKQDVVPGRYTALWFEATKLGSFYIFCAELCGTAHSSMMGKIHVLSEDDFAAWLEAGEVEQSLAAKGKTLTLKKGCTACHSQDGSTKVGPSFKGFFGKQRTFADGSTVMADENYVRESILSPNAKVVKGFPGGVMPTFQGLVSDKEIDAFIEYLKEIR